MSHGSEEKTNNQLNPQVKSSIDQIWSDPSIDLVEVNEIIAENARDLIRNSIENGWSLKSKDAVHLATAKWVDKYIYQIKEFFTFDGRLKKYEILVGFPIKEPYANQPGLFTPKPNQPTLN